MVAGPRGPVHPHDLAWHRSSGNVTHTRTGLKVGTIESRNGTCQATHTDGHQTGPARTGTGALTRLASYHNAQVRKRGTAPAAPAAVPAAAGDLGPVGQRAYSRLVAKGAGKRQAVAMAARAEKMLMTGKA